jgi:hypothetical protein
MRRFGLLVMIVGALVPRGAGADPEEAVQPRPQAKLGVAVLVNFAAWDVGPLSFDGNGADVEVAMGVGKRGQVAVAGFLGRLDEYYSDIEGTQGRLGLTARWFPRTFHLDRHAAYEMYLEGGTGMQRTWWDGGGRLTRHDVSLGVGTQFRFAAAGQSALRAGVKFIWAEPPPLAQLERAVCRGSCPDSGRAASVDTAVMGQLGLSWGR